MMKASRREALSPPQQAPEKRIAPVSMTWQQQLAHAYTDINTLLSELDLDTRQLPTLDNTHKHSFSLRVPKGFVARMEKGNPRDPLLRQILPLEEENKKLPGYQQDPLEETGLATPPGLLHKYHGRVLLTLTGACAIHCRYCFRRHFPYTDNNPQPSKNSAALDYIQTHQEIQEVILSGGDPLSVNDNVIDNVLTRLDNIPHVRYLRIHTRLPIVLPDRITDTLIDRLTQSRLRITMVMHCNHANEIDANVISIFNKLKHAGITLFNQSVLLRGVNDHKTALEQLSYKLFDNGVLPYYLHLLDKVNGAAHFHVDTPEAVAIQQSLLASLPGYLVPRLVKEEPGKQSKTWINLDM